MFVLKTLIFCAAWLCINSQGHNGPTTTPVPILKQINRQNDDGSYSFGYEGADGSFKVETKYPNGDVAGKYGYVDETGKLREITYGASSKRGFEPQGSGIMVPPPTLNDQPTNALTDGQEDDGQYREDPKIYEDPKYNGRAQSRPSASFRQFHKSAQPEQYEPQYQQPQPSFQQQQYQPSQLRSAPLYSQQTSLFNQPQQQSLFNQPQQQSLFNQPQQQSLFNQPQQQSLFNQQSQFSQSPQKFPQQEYRPQSQIYHQQPQFSYSAYTPTAQAPQYNQYQNYNPYFGHPAQNIDPSTGSYTIDFTGK